MFFILLKILITLLCAFCIPKLVEPFEAGYGVVTFGAVILYLIFALVFWIWIFPLMPIF